LYAGAIFIEQSLKWDTYASIFALLAVAAVFTITGEFYQKIKPELFSAVTNFLTSFKLFYQPREEQILGSSILLADRGGANLND